MILENRLGNKYFIWDKTYLTRLNLLPRSLPGCVAGDKISNLDLSHARSGQFVVFSTTNTNGLPRSHVVLQATTRARDLILSLVEEQQCFISESGARAFGEVCAANIVYEDCYEPQPVVGKTVREIPWCSVV